MFNLFISSGDESWTSSPAEIDKDRFLEYTNTDIQERYRELSPEKIEEIKSFPCLFVTENETVPSKVGYLTNLRVRQNAILIDFEFEDRISDLPCGKVRELGLEIDLGNWELSRTHWALKNESLLNILVQYNLATQQQVNASQTVRGLIDQTSNQEPTLGLTYNNSQVFIVHGHDDITKLAMSDFIHSIGLEPIVLHMQASGGRTIIEKLEEYTNVGFGIVLYTPCDMGAKKGSLVFTHRARQNVVFEHGYLLAKLGRDRVAAIVKDDTEYPNDFSGVVYITLDNEEQWKLQLINELRNVGYNVAIDA